MRCTFALAVLVQIRWSSEKIYEDREVAFDILINSALIRAALDLGCILCGSSERCPCSLLTQLYGWAVNSLQYIWAGLRFLDRMLQVHMFSVHLLIVMTRREVCFP